MNKYTKAIPKDWPLKKRPRSPPRQDMPTSPSGESSKCRGDVTTLFPPLRVYATMPWLLPASDSSCPAWEHGGFWMRCYPMSRPPPYQREGESRGHVFDRLWWPVHDRLGQRQSVWCSTPHRSDRSPTGQTDLSRYWPNFILQSKNTILKRRRTKASTCRFILGRPQSMMSCRLAMSKLVSKTWKRDRWFLGNGSKSLSWTMTMKPAIETPRINTLNLGGTHQG